MSGIQERPELARVFVGKHYFREVYELPDDPSNTCELVVVAVHASAAVALQIDAGQDIESFVKWKDEARDGDVLVERILSAPRTFDLILFIAVIVCAATLLEFLP